MSCSAENPAPWRRYLGTHLPLACLLCSEFLQRGTLTGANVQGQTWGLIFLIFVPVEGQPWVGGGLYSAVSADVQTCTKEVPPDSCELVNLTNRCLLRGSNL